MKIELKSARTCLALWSPVLRPYFPLPEPWQARIVDTPEQMLEQLPQALPNWVALVVPGDECPPPLVGRLVERAGMVPVVAAVEISAARAEMLAQLWDAGISGVIDLNPPPTAGELLEELRDAHARPFKARIEAALSPRVSMNALSLLRAAAEVVVDRGASADVAVRLAVLERTVLNWCTREHLPPPKRVLLWLRIALAAALLEQPGRSINAAARAVGYSNENSLRRALRGELGPAFASAPRTATFTHVLDRLNAELRDLREAAREAARAVRRGKAA